jgi:hypothetical protein
LNQYSRSYFQTFWPSQLVFYYLEFSV